VFCLDSPSAFDHVSIETVCVLQHSPEVDLSEVEASKILCLNIRRDSEATLNEFPLPELDRLVRNIIPIEDVEYMFYPALRNALPVRR
jgi:hypothetical protein